MIMNYLLILLTLRTLTSGNDDVESQGKSDPRDLEGYDENFGQSMQQIWV